MNADHDAPAGTPIVTLATGEAVFNTDPLWAEECRQRHAHVLHLRGIRDSAQRRQYVEAVRRAEGDLSAERLKAAYTADWEQRKAAAEAAKGQAA